MVEHLRHIESNRARVSSEENEERNGEAIDHYFARARGSFRYLGRSACLTPAYQPHSNSLRTYNLSSTPCPIWSISGDLNVESEMHQFLIETYLSQVHPLFLILDLSKPCFQPDFPFQSNLPSMETFSLQMMYAIACYCLPEHFNRLSLLADACYNRALTHVERATSEINLDTLQSITLLAFHSLFKPQGGNIGQQIAFASRIETELNSQEANHTDLRLRSLQSAIFCIGMQVSTVLDRPSGLLEPVKIPCCLFDDIF